ncbi:Uncharacterized protein involved in methicillin resistance [Bordetella ansorpii]|uniref:Uncharacterized protein involved in methicillin resistance n=1 Tax=Bordetella ansorpii TaxID=288768 RepID=A0A157S9U4_9BORD|nr:GNAT family N-acetyltransferase [Bordetella ansorpii]SAI67134.1 Uncharacterized protein involved in methicillin resistance [Bordetella ansorpii]
MSLEIKPYGPDEEGAWDRFCGLSPNATLLHTRRFLSYHGDRFTDRSLLILRDGELAGVLPAAELPSDHATVASHPGATYGGIVHQGQLRGAAMIDALSAVARYYASQGYQRLQYKPVPHIYCRRPSQDDLYALFRLDAARVRTDLSCAIDLMDRGDISKRRLRSRKKAAAAVTLSADSGLLAPLWHVLAGNLARKHDAWPVHSLEELALLHSRFPEHIQVRCALVDGQVEAGVVFFNAAPAWHAQYIAASERGYDVCALDAVFAASIAEADQTGARYFDFGTSNEHAGRVLNDGLYRFKSEFGGSGVAHDYYEIELAGHG